MLGLLDGFNKIEVGIKKDGNGEKIVRIRKYGNGSLYPSISTAAMEAAGFKQHDKVDLYGKAGTFALKKSATGMYKLNRNGGNVASRISSTAMCREIKSLSNFAEVFDAWGIPDAGILFFKVRKEDE